MECYRHKKVETAVRCGRCDKPICPKCMIPGPAGMRCPDCASLRSSALYQIHPARLTLAAVCGGAVAVAGAFMLSALTFWIFFAAPLYGGVVAEVILRASGRKRGPILEVIGVGGIVVGFLLALLPRILGLFGTGAAAAGVGGLGLGFGISSVLWPLVGCALAISACYGRLKYL